MIPLNKRTKDRPIPRIRPLTVDQWTKAISNDHRTLVVHQAHNPPDGFASVPSQPLPPLRVNVASPTGLDIIDSSSSSNDESLAHLRAIFSAWCREWDTERTKVASVIAWAEIVLTQCLVASSSLPRPHFMRLATACGLLDAVAPSLGPAAPLLRTLIAIVLGSTFIDYGVTRLPMPQPSPPRVPPLAPFASSGSLRPSSPANAPPTSHGGAFGGHSGSAPVSEDYYRAALVGFTPPPFVSARRLLPSQGAAASPQRGTAPLAAPHPPHLRLANDVAAAPAALAALLGDSAAGSLDVTVSSAAMVDLAAAELAMRRRGAVGGDGAAPLGYMCVRAHAVLTRLGATGRAQAALRDAREGGGDVGAAAAAAAVAGDAAGVGSAGRGAGVGAVALESADASRETSPSPPPRHMYDATASPRAVVASAAAALPQPPALGEYADLTTYASAYESLRDGYQRLVTTSAGLIASSHRDVAGLRRQVSRHERSSLLRYLRAWRGVVALRANAAVTALRVRDIRRRHQLERSFATWRVWVLQRKVVAVEVARQKAVREIKDAADTEVGGLKRQVAVLTADLTTARSQLPELLMADANAGADTVQVDSMRVQLAAASARMRAAVERMEGMEGDLSLVQDLYFESRAHARTLLNQALDMLRAAVDPVDTSLPPTHTDGVLVQGMHPAAVDIVSGAAAAKTSLQQGGHMDDVDVPVSYGAIGVGDFGAFGAGARSGAAADVLGVSLLEGLTCDDVIIHWANNVLRGSGATTRSLSNFAADFADGEIYVAIIAAVFPGVYAAVEDRTLREVLALPLSADRIAVGAKVARRARVVAIDVQTASDPVANRARMLDMLARWVDTTRPSTASEVDAVVARVAVEMPPDALVASVAVDPAAAAAAAAAAAGAQHGARGAAEWGADGSSVAAAAAAAAASAAAEAAATHRLNADAMAADETATDRAIGLLLDALPSLMRRTSLSESSWRMLLRWAGTSALALSAGPANGVGLGRCIGLSADAVTCASAAGGAASGDGGSGGAVGGDDAKVLAEKPVYTRLKTEALAELSGSDSYLEQGERLRAFLEVHWRTLRQIYTYYSSITAISAQMTLQEYWRFVDDLKIVGKNLPKQVVDVVFIRSNWTKDDADGGGARGAAGGGGSSKALVGKAGGRNENSLLGHLKELDANEFVEAIVRLALAYAGAGTAATSPKGAAGTAAAVAGGGAAGVSLVDKVARFITEIVVPRAMSQNTDEFKRLIYSPPVQLVINQYQRALLRIFTHYRDADGSDGRNQSINLAEFSQLVKDADLMDKTLTRTAVANIFNAAQDAEDTAGGETDMVFREFLEAVVTLALYKIPNPMQVRPYRRARGLARVRGALHVVFVVCEAAVARSYVHMIPSCAHDVLSLHTAALPHHSLRRSE